MRRQKKELWENLMVVWKDTSGWVDKPRWYLTEVVNHNTSADPSAPKRVLFSELQESVWRDNVITAESKEEALLKYAAYGRARKTVWSISGGESVSYSFTPANRHYDLIKENF